MSDRPTQDMIKSARNYLRVASKWAYEEEYVGSVNFLMDILEKLREVIGDNLPEDELTEEQLRDAQETKERLLGVVKLAKENQGLQKNVQRLTEEVEMWKKSNERWAILAQSPSSYDDQAEPLPTPADKLDKP